MLHRRRGLSRAPLRRVLLLAVVVALLIVCAVLLLLSRSSSPSALPLIAAIPTACQAATSSSAIFITSITRPFRDHAASREWRHTLWQQQSSSRNSDIPLWVYTENTWEVAHGRRALEKDDLPFATCVLDVFQVSDSASSPLHHSEAIDRFYTLPGTPGLNDRIMDGKVLVRKVASIHHAVSVVPDGTLVIWLDVDVVFSKRELDDAFYQFAMSRDVSYLAETTCWRRGSEFASYAELPQECLDFRVDTGILTFTASALTRRFTQWWLDSYSAGRGKMLSLASACFKPEAGKLMDEAEVLHTFAGNPHSRHHDHVSTVSDLCNIGYIRSSLGLNDIHTFALGLHAFGSELRHGWLAYKTSGCAANSEASTLAGGHCHPCAAASNTGTASLVSPFTASDYLFHVKGGSAIMARQHTARSEQALKQVKTADEELLLPAEYFPIASHIDHRMACGDKRSRYGEIYSLNQL